MDGFEEAANFQLEHLESMRSFLGPPTAEDASQHSKRDSTITFKNPRAQQFFVDGSKLPDGALTYYIFCRSSLICHGAVNFDAGPSWAGLMPISGDPHETRKLFFWCALRSTFVSSISHASAGSGQPQTHRIKTTSYSGPTVSSFD